MYKMDEEAGTGDVNCIPPPIPVSAAVRESISTIDTTDADEEQGILEASTYTQFGAAHTHSILDLAFGPTLIQLPFTVPIAVLVLLIDVIVLAFTFAITITHIQISIPSLPQRTPRTRPTHASAQQHPPQPSSSTAQASPSPRSSPLFQRLLQPFIRSPSPAPTTAAANASLISSESNTTESVEETSINSSISNEINMAALHYYQHQPTPPHLYQNPTQTQSPGQTQPSSSSIPPTSTPTSPPSRSERLLRDALIRDELERSSPSAGATAGSVSSSSSAPPSSSRPGHLRRHSHVPTSSPSTFGGSSHSPLAQRDTEEGEQSGRRRESRGQTERRREQYTGSFLFRTAMSNPSAGGVSVSPEPDHEHEHEEGSDMSASLVESLSGSGSGSGRRTGRGTTDASSYYGGDAESGSRGHARSASLSPSPLRRRPGYASPAEQHAAHARWQMQLALFDQQQLQQQAAAAAGSRSPQQPPPRSPQMSPYSSPRSPRRPSSQPPRDGSKGSPMPMTPHEQVLRSRLERVLEAGRVVQERERARSKSKSKSNSSGGQDREVGAGSDIMSIVSGSSGGGVVEDDSRRGRSGGRPRSSRTSMSRDNEVRDEQGGWPWREKGRGSGGAEDEQPVEPFGFGIGDAEISASPVSLSITSLPKPNSNSPVVSGHNPNLNHSTSRRQSTTPMSHTPMTPSHVPSTPSRAAAFTPGHGRTRSKTGPDTSVPNTPSPRRNTSVATPNRAAAPASRIPVRLDSSKMNGSPASRVGDSRAKRGGEGASRNLDNSRQQREEDGDDEDDELRLLTPPPTPPFTARAFSASHGLSLAGKMPPGSVFGEYCPSPYKSSYPAGVQQPPETPSKASGLGRGLNGTDGPRRPANVPLSSSGLELASEPNATRAKAGRYFPGGSSSSSSASSSDGSEPHSPGDGAAVPFDPTVLDGPSLSSPAVNQLQYLQKTHQYQQSAGSSSAAGARMAPSTRPAFNARKASERCRAIEGYVSFASVEGLGEPPGAAFGDENEAGANAGSGTAGTGNGGGMLGVAWGGWRRLLGVGGSAAQAQDEGVVL
ncbi:hypothetical protein JR316_0001638 [Psilocybe cubensis]|uniref:Uncharacterized protein n=1 Tax=Psilocybe cubensis TaxID=181762 RepID=A0ACB8HA94_PSICU|nr:hypothetical protein JR316_0001638 [Psilocybe cubensis]KAH9484738.1 hypothetical protein JR316_0001638 [Psilocybe cubensis]